MEWSIILEVVGVVGGIATILAFLVAPMFWLGSKIDAFRQEIHSDMKEFREEVKLFHGRLSALEGGRKKD